MKIELPIYPPLQNTTMIIIINYSIVCVGNKLQVRRLSIAELIPDTENYITYDGSTSMPACHETVTWLILNKPIYITKQQVSLQFLFSSIDRFINFDVHYW